MQWGPLFGARRGRHHLGDGEHPADPRHPAPRGRRDGGEHPLDPRLHRRRDGDGRGPARQGRRPLRGGDARRPAGRVRRRGPLFALLGPVGVPRQRRALPASRCRSTAGASTATSRRRSRRRTRRAAARIDFSRYRADPRPEPRLAARADVDRDQCRARPVHDADDLPARPRRPTRSSPTSCCMGGFGPLQISVGLVVGGLLFFAGLIYWGNRFKTLRRTTIILYGLGGGALLVVAAVAINHSATLPGGRAAGLVGASAVFGLFVLAGATPAAIGLLADVTEAYPDDRGAIMGLYSVFLGLGQIGGSLIAGFAASALGLDGIFVASLVLLVARRRAARLPAPARALPRRSGDPGVDRLTSTARRRSIDRVRTPADRWTRPPCAILPGTGDAPRSHEAVTGLPSSPTDRRTRMTSNVGQNYPYSSETEADRAAAIAALVEARDGPRGQARRGDDAARRARPLVDLEVPDHGLPGHPPRRRLRPRPPRRLRRLRRDLRQDVPALNAARPRTVTLRGPSSVRVGAMAEDRRATMTARRFPAPPASSRTRSGSWSPPAGSGSSTGSARGPPGSPRSRRAR